MRFLKISRIPRFLIKKTLSKIGIQENLHIST